MDFQTAPNIALQANAPGLGIVMLLTSLLGSAEFYLAIIPVVLWCYDKTLGLRLLILCSVSAAINAMLKLLFHAPRPYWISVDVKAFASEPSFGMPSAAAQISLTSLGYIGAWFRKTRVWIICFTLIILVGIARMYLGVHFLIDILTGWIFALVLLLVFLYYENAAATWFLQKTVPVRILLALGTSYAFVLISQIVIFSFGTWQVPVGWSELAYAQTNLSISPVTLKDTLLAAGLLFGATAGAGISAEYIPYGVDGSRSQKAIRFFTGIIVLAILWITLSALTKSPDLFGYSMTYFRAALAGAWITAGAPLLFKKFMLVSSE
jgi:membrane-associated phospholipid phosphatase